MNSRIVVILLTLMFAVLASAFILRPSAARTTVPVYSLGIDESAFWSGPYVDTSNACENCEFKLITSGGAARLRIALDLLLDYASSDVRVHPDAGAGRAFRVEIIDAQGNQVLAASSNYSAELFLCFNTTEFCKPWRGPAGYSDESPYAKSLATSSEGAWTIRVVPEDSSGWQFRMRAKLEGPIAPPSASEQLPNLRAIPPFELTFYEPQVSIGFHTAHTPVPGNGCTADEEAELAPQHTGDINYVNNVRCMRFSAGPENVGPGDFEVRGSALSIDGSGNFVAYQRTYNGDRTLARDRAVGALEYHTTHNHWHYKLFSYELFEVVRQHPTKTSKKIKLSERTPGKKVGFCPSDERLADWNNHFQDSRDRWRLDRREEGEPGCLSPANPMMGLSSGWGDLYEWARIEQMVEFPANADGSVRDGVYFLRSTVDSGNRIFESNENDNSSYVLFRVANGQIEIVQRGYGMEP